MKKKSWKQWVGEYFHFTRSERIAVTVVLAGLFLIKVAPYYWPVREPAHVQVPDSLLQQLIAADRSFESDYRSSSPNSQSVRSDSRSFDSGNRSFGSNPRSVGSNHRSYSSNELSLSSYKKKYSERWSSTNAAPAELFRFDPNLATEADLERLGLTPSMIRTFVKFRDKGGRFRSPEDIRKIYGIPPALAERLEPYVQIKSERAGGPALFADVKKQRIRKAQAGSIISIDINRADSLDWLALPGIGPKLSSRILQYRDRLGGFYTIEQVAEVFGLADSVYQRIRGYLRIESPQPRQVNINEARLEELAAHPYIRWKLADAIVNYRATHGGFRDSRELAKLHMVNEELLNKLIYYCKIE